MKSALFPSRLGAGASAVLEASADEENEASVVRIRGVDLAWRKRPRSGILETAIRSVIALAPTGDNHNRGGHSCLRSLRRQRRTSRSSVL
jgi:hypothetical protein